MDHKLLSLQDRGNLWKIVREFLKVTACIILFYLADVNGSLEAILDAVMTYKAERPKLSVVSSGVGPVTENDIRVLEPFKGTLSSLHGKR